MYGIYSNIFPPFLRLRSPRRSPPLGQSYDSTMSGFDGYAAKSFTEKDDKILSLQEKNIELERHIMDLEENLKAKVCVCFLGVRC